MEHKEYLIQKEYGFYCLNGIYEGFQNKNTAVKNTDSTKNKNLKRIRIRNE